MLVRTDADMVVLSSKLNRSNVGQLAAAGALCALVGATVAAVPAPLSYVLFASLFLFGLIALISSRGGHWPITVALAWYAVVGTDLDTGVSLAGAQLPLSYLVLILLLVVAAMVHLTRQQSVRYTSPSAVARYVGLGVATVALFVMVGLLNANNPVNIREDSVLTSVVVVTGVIALLSFSRTSITGFAVALAAIAVMASLKTIWIALTGTVLTDPGLIQAYSRVNPQLLVQRVILLGGGTLLTVGIPVGVGLLRVTRGWQSLALVPAIALMGLGLSLTYTRSFFGGVAIGCIVALLVRLGPEARSPNVYFKIAAATALILFLLGFTFGQSDYSVLQGLIRRVFEGQGSSGVDIRLGDALAALSGFGPIQILVGRGLGATFVSPINTAYGPTGFVESGYVWLFLKGGVLLTLVVSLALTWSVVTFLRAARHAERTAGGSLAGLCGALACFVAVNLLGNRFASVEGTAFLGASFGVAILVSRMPHSSVRAVPSKTETPQAPLRSDRISTTKYPGLEKA